MQSSGGSGARILVAYASAHGSTEGIAKSIGERLTKAGHTVDVRSVDAIDYLDRYDAVILGSAIHNTEWLPAAFAFAERHTAELKLRPVWCFSVSSLGETSSFFGPMVSRFMRRARKGRETEEMAVLRRNLRPRDHRYFAGAVETEQWGRIGTLFMRALGGSFGDHRDWSDIQGWADGIAKDLSRATRAALAAS